MSGYRRDGRDDSHDHYRERSPRRDSHTDWRRDRGRDEHQGGYPHGRDQRRPDGRDNVGRHQDSNSRNQGYGQRRDNGRISQQQENLAPVPESVPIPDGRGRSVDLKVLKVSRGTVGRSIRVLANHFVVQSLPIVKIYQYDVRMRVPVGSQRRGNAEMSAAHLKKGWIALEEGSHMGTNYVHDGVSTIWTCDSLLPEGSTEDNLLLDLPGHQDDRPNQVQISVRLQRNLRIRALVDYLTSGRAGTHSGNAEVDDCFRFMEALFKDGPRRKFLSFPKSTSFFVRAPGLTQTLPSTNGVLEAIRGIHQSVSVGFNTLTLNIDTKTAAFYVDGRPLSQLIRAGVDPSGLYFVVRHLPAAHRNETKRKVQRLSTGDAQTTTFEWTDPGTNAARTISVADYFSHKYNIQLKNPRDKLVICKDGAFPAELCFTASGERYKEPLQGKETADFIKFATGPAYVRKDQIMGNVARIAHWQEPKIASMGLSVSPKMLELPALVLPPPTPMYQNGPISQSDASRGSWNLRGARFVDAAEWNSWAIVCIVGLRGAPRQEDVVQVGRKLYDACQGHSMIGPRGAPPVILGSLQRPVDAAINDGIAAMLKTFPGQSKPLLVVLLQADMPVSIYKQVKQILELHKGIPSQVMLTSKCMGPRGGSPQYMSNVAMKVNIKLGGRNAQVTDPLLNGKTIILGADVSHPSPGELRSATPPPSLAALVCSLDAECARYTAVCAAQQSRQELISCLTMQAMVKELFGRYKNEGHSKPERIIYFRDSVSNSQIDNLETTEIRAIKDVRDTMAPGCKITVIHTIKRHHTRLFPVDRRESDKLGNVLPGTVVENSVKNNDIFMVSQSALQGTVRPTHYVTLLDENDFSINDFERIILHGCFSYQRATRSVSIHSAVYYADQCAERAKLRLIEQDGSLILKDVHPKLPGMYWQ